MHYFSNNSTVWSKLFCLYYGCHTSTHWSDDIFQGIRPFFLLQSLLWVGLFLPHLIHRLHYWFQNLILNLVMKAWAVDNWQMQLITKLWERESERERERERAIATSLHLCEISCTFKLLNYLLKNQFFIQCTTSTIDIKFGTNNYSDTLTWPCFA